MPEPEETPVAREASRLLDEFLEQRVEQQLSELGPDEQRRVAEQAQLELNRMYGS
jgi:hypothetical protein